MPKIYPRLQSSTRAALVAAVVTIASAALVPTHAQISDAIRGAPSEANHFIETPEGWQHPRTPWGEPDIQAKLDMMQASRVPLERCADRFPSRRLPTFLYGGDADGTLGTLRVRDCDLDKAWLTRAEYDQRIDLWRNSVDASRQALAEGDLAVSLQAGAIDPSIPQRQTNLIVDPATGMLPTLTPEGKRRALRMRSSWALPGENHTYDWVDDFDS